MESLSEESDEEDTSTSVIAPATMIDGAADDVILVAAEFGLLTILEDDPVVERRIVSEPSLDMFVVVVRVVDEVGPYYG